MTRAYVHQQLGHSALERCAKLHACGFVRPWSSASIAQTLAGNAVFAVLSHPASPDTRGKRGEGGSPVCAERSTREDETVSADGTDSAGSPGIAEKAVGFALFQCAQDVLELITVAVQPAFRGAGHGAAIVAVGLAHGRKQGAHAAFLEVAADNHAGLGLYQAMGFSQVSVRARYYRTTPQRMPGAPEVTPADVNGVDAVDAIVMRRSI